ncbi:MAG: DUF3592 domain-containing protein [Desulfobacterales bacterium]|nr:DUF3592 domain-containing protein [Desulfobacterales bacterium]
MTFLQNWHSNFFDWPIIIAEILAVVTPQLIDINNISLKRRTMLALRLIFIVFIGLPICLIGAGGHGLYTSYQIKTKWGVTEARVLSSKVKRFVQPKRIFYRPYIMYEYEVNGVKYRSNNVSTIGFFDTSYTATKEIIDEHPKGKLITIHYDKKNPDDAVIINNIAMSVLITGLGIIMISGIFFILFRSPEIIREIRPPSL